MSMEIALTYLITYLVAAAIELFVIYLFIRRSVMKGLPLTKSVYIVNLITFPPTQVLAFVLVYFYYNVPMVHYGAEVIPFSLEYFLLKWQFKKLVKSGAMSGLPSNGRIFISMVAANLTTFLLGILIFEHLGLFV